MSYEKAMKHWNNHKKNKKSQYMGFDTGIRFNETPEQRKVLMLHLNINQWFKDRHKHPDKQHTNECIKEAIADLKQHTKQ